MIGATKVGKEMVKWSSSSKKSILRRFPLKEPKHSERIQKESLIHNKTRIATEPRKKTTNGFPYKR